jgi:hypothetical protein
MTKMIRGTLINLVLLFVSTNGWALSGARLLGQSKSGQTALFNLGTYDGVKEGEYAVIVKEIRDLDARDLRIVPVAKARNVKLNTTNSVWILYRIFDPELLVKGHRYLVLSESHMLSGRRDPRLGRVSVVTERDKVSLQTLETLSDDKDRLAKLKTQYPEIMPLHEREKKSDGELVDVETWKDFRGDRYRTALYKSPHQNDFRRELRLQTFEKLVTAYLKRVNDPAFSYDKFYDQQMRDNFSNEFRKRSSFSTEYEAFVSTQAQKAVDDAKLYRSLLEDGESWSENFSDDELKRLLGQVSVLQEKDRRAYIYREARRYTTYLSFGMNLSEDQTEKDPRYRREGSYSAETELEAVPFLKHDVLERFTLTGGIRMNRTAFASRNYNARLDELSLTAGANWFPIYAPYAYEAPVIFLGLYVRNGGASAEAPSVDEQANYTVLALPGVRGGLKYNFKNNVGLRIAFSMETLTLDRYEQSRFGSVLPDREILREAKMNFALAYSF